nr:unnamed protein product [Digitaria exilis]
MGSVRLDDGGNGEADAPARSSADRGPRRRSIHGTSICRSTAARLSARPPAGRWFPPSTRRPLLPVPPPADRETRCRTPQEEADAGVVA